MKPYAAHPIDFIAFALQWRPVAVFWSIFRWLDLCHGLAVCYPTHV